MRVLVAPGRFGPLTSIEAAAIIADSWSATAPYVDLDQLPQADGTTGTAAVLAAVEGGTETVLDVDGVLVPVFRRADRAWWDAALAENLGTARTNGQVARLLLDHDVREFVIGVGGCRTLDGGKGFVAGLTAQKPGADSLQQARKQLADTRITAVADTDRALLGFQGASFSAIEERGLSKVEAQTAEQQMGEWTDVVRSALPPVRDLLQDKQVRLDRTPGAGAGGGLAFVLRALGAQVVPGPAYVAERTGLVRRIASADLVVTATAVFDWRTLEHHVVAEVTSLAAAAATPVVLMADEVHVGRREQMSLGLQGAYSLTTSGRMRREPLDLASLPADLAALAARVAGTWTPPPRTDVR